jgi:hypothetical protein
MTGSYTKHYTQLTKLKIYKKQNQSWEYYYRLIKDTLIVTELVQT